MAIDTVVVIEKKKKKVADFAYLVLQKCFKVVQAKVIFLLLRLRLDCVKIIQTCLYFP